jgi:hypothetical protein
LFGAKYIPIFEHRICHSCLLSNNSCLFLNNFTSHCHIFPFACHIQVTNSPQGLNVFPPSAISHILMFCSPTSYILCVCSCCFNHLQISNWDCSGNGYCEAFHWRATLLVLMRYNQINESTTPLSLLKKKSQNCPTTRHGGAWGQRRYSSTFLTLALDGGEWSASCPGCALVPGKGSPGTHCTGGWVGTRASLDTNATGKILFIYFIYIFKALLWTVLLTKFDVHYIAHLMMLTYLPNNYVAYIPHHLWYT